MKTKRLKNPMLLERIVKKVMAPYQQNFILSRVIVDSLMSNTAPQHSRLCYGSLDPEFFLS